MTNKRKLKKKVRDRAERNGMSYEAAHNIEVAKFPSIKEIRNLISAHYYWSREPGVFVNKKTGVRSVFSELLGGGPKFTGTDEEWNETLVETIIDMANSLRILEVSGANVLSIPKMMGFRIFVSEAVFQILNKTLFMNMESCKLIYDIHLSSEVEDGEILILNDGGVVGKISVLDL